MKLQDCVYKFKASETMYKDPSMPFDKLVLKSILWFSYLKFALTFSNEENCLPITYFSLLEESFICEKLGIQSNKHAFSFTPVN